MDDGVSIPSRGNDGIFSPLRHVQNGSGAHQAAYPMLSRTLTLGVNVRYMKLTAQLHIVTKLRMRGAIPPLPNTPSWCGASLSKTLLLVLS
jgi:hypothetical protein